MVAKMTHPLQVSPHYVPIDDRFKEEVVVEVNKKPKPLRNKGRVHADQLLAKKYGEANSYFYPYTSPKRNRAFLILGKGNKEKGYLKYLYLKRDTLMKFKFTVEIIKKNRHSGRFSEFLNKEISYLSSFMSRVAEKGIKTHLTLMDVHRVNKQYTKFLKEIK